MRVLVSAVASFLAKLRSWAAPSIAAGTWLTCTTRMPIGRRRTGIAAAKRRARKARNQRRHKHGRS